MFSSTLMSHISNIEDFLLCTSCEHNETNDVDSICDSCYDKFVREKTKSRNIVMKLREDYTECTDVIKNSELCCDYCGTHNSTGLTNCPTVVVNGVEIIVCDPFCGSFVATRSVNCDCYTAVYNEKTFLSYPKCFPVCGHVTTYLRSIDKKKQRRYWLMSGDELNFIRLLKSTDISSQEELNDLIIWIARYAPNYFPATSWLVENTSIDLIENAIGLLYPIVLKHWKKELFTSF